MKMEFSSKAQTLKKLRQLCLQKNHEFSVLPLYIIDAQTAISHTENAIKEIESFAQKIGAKKIILRSSSEVEDTSEKSNAGAFLSINGVPTHDAFAIKAALVKVAASMPPNAKNEILIQPSLDLIHICGVAFTHDKDNLSPYFCVSYDDSGSTSSVTGGDTTIREKYFFHFRDADEPKDFCMARLIAACRKLEKIFENTFLDIEFAFLAKNQKIQFKNEEDNQFICDVPIILQVRPIVKQGKKDLSGFVTKKSLERLKARFVSLQRSPPNLLGDRAIFSVMSDWNPAEMIGLRPKRLALSLYKEIITDGVWSQQRADYGYRELGPLPLVHSFLGIPYVDVRSSFNSFVPRHLDEKIAKKLVNFYLDKLARQRELHDKIEFAIVFSCYTFSTANKLDELRQAGFNTNEIKRIEFSLLELTNSIIGTSAGLYLNDLKKVSRLSKIFSQINDKKFSAIDKIYQFLGECKKYGTLPFAGIARAAFIATSILNSLVEIGFFTEKEKSAFLNSLFTVSKNLNKELLLAKNTGDFSSFLKEFGHLRAGTYDIMSPRYDEAFADYFNLDNIVDNTQNEIFEISLEKKSELDNILRENGFLINSDALFKFFKTAIEGREFAKFEFTKLLSAAISQIADEIGSQYDICREDLAHVDIHDILNLYSTLSSKSPRERLLEQIEYNKTEYNTALAVKLPQVLADTDQIFSFFADAQRPNFVTQKSLAATVHFMNSGNEKHTDLHGKIVLVESADPGWDFLFSKGIAGLITCYGGANSHMAVRASELALPAAIGCGGELFEKLKQAKTVLLDCAQEKIEVVI